MSDESAQFFLSFSFQRHLFWMHSYPIICFTLLFHLSFLFSFLKVEILHLSETRKLSWILLYLFGLLFAIHCHLSLPQMKLHQLDRHIFYLRLSYFRIKFLGFLPACSLLAFFWITHPDSVFNHLAYIFWGFRSVVQPLQIQHSDSMFEEENWSNKLNIINIYYCLYSWDQLGLLPFLLFARDSTVLTKSFYL